MMLNARKYYCSRPILELCFSFSYVTGAIEMEPNRLSRRSILAATPNVPEIGWIWIPDDEQFGS